MTPLGFASGVWKRVMEFLFPPETDAWLAVFRVGLGLQVVVYALFLRSDWHYLFAATGKGLVSRELGEAITSFDRSEEHTSELQSPDHLVCRLLLEKKKIRIISNVRHTRNRFSRAV